MGNSVNKYERQIWDMLLEGIGNPYGVAGLMGNLMAESSMNLFCKTGGKGETRSLSGLEYAHKVMCGDISPEAFAHDGVAFGLAQWCYWSRKRDLFEYVRKNQLDIGSIEGQVGYLLKEIKKYKTVWNVLTTTKSVAEASDIVLLRYEKPADTSDRVKAKRLRYSEEIFDRYADSRALSIKEMAQILTDIAQETLLMKPEHYDKLLLVIDNLEELAKTE